MIKVSNIGPGQRQRRRVIGVIAVSLGVGLAVALIGLRVTPGWLLLTFVPFFVGMLGFVQAREHT
jgi:uncharacterized membrane protein YccC